MTVGKMFHEARLEKHKKIEDVAATANLSVEVLGAIEQNKHPISDGAIVYDLAKALSISTGELLGNPKYESQSRREARKVLRPYLWQLAKERGERLKNRREYVGYSIAEAAKQLNRSASFINEHERGSTLSIPYEIAQQFAKVYECEVDWILGNQPDNILGQSISGSTTFCRQDLFWVYPSHITELQINANINDRQMEKRVGISVANLRAYSKLQRIEISEPTFACLCEIFEVGPNELRGKPIQKLHQITAETAEPQEISSESMCENIIAATENGTISKRKFCNKFNLNNTQWQMIQSKKMKFSPDAIAVICPLLGAKQI